MPRDRGKPAKATVDAKNAVAPTTPRTGSRSGERGCGGDQQQRRE